MKIESFVEGKKINPQDRLIYGIIMAKILQIRKKSQCIFSTETTLKLQMSVSVSSLLGNAFVLVSSFSVKIHLI